MTTVSMWCRCNIWVVWAISMWTRTSMWATCCSIASSIASSTCYFCITMIVSSCATIVPATIYFVHYITCTSYSTCLTFKMVLVCSISFSTFWACHIRNMSLNYWSRAWYFATSSAFTTCSRWTSLAIWCITCSIVSWTVCSCSSWFWTSSTFISIWYIHIVIIICIIW